MDEEVTFKILRYLLRNQGKTRDNIARALRLPNNTVNMQIKQLKDAKVLKISEKSVNGIRNKRYYLVTDKVYHELVGKED